jgi:biopolymer transport protein ExbB
MNKGIMERIHMKAFFFCLLVCALPGISRAESQSSSAVMNISQTDVKAGVSTVSEKSGVDKFKAMVQETGIYHIFKKGGPIMWPLLLASILAMGTVIERVFFMIKMRCSRDSKAMANFFAEICHGNTEAAIGICDSSKFFVLRTLGYALKHRGKSLSNALLYAQEQEIKKFRHGIPTLDTVITLAPLLGLLGTVTGMMGSFSLIGGELSAPGAITGGIAEALIATAFGLGIAITSLIPFNFLNTKMENARIEIETAAKKLEFLMAKESVGTRFNQAGQPVKGQLFAKVG